MKMVGKLLLAILIVIILLAYIYRAELTYYFFKPTNTSLKTGVTKQLSEMKLGGDDQTEQQVQVIAANLSIPWEIVFLPDQSLLVTERPGRLLRVSGTDRTPIKIEGVEHVGEGGLLGLALHPDFETNHWLYLYLTTRTDGGLTNRVERYEFDNGSNRLSNKQIILDHIPGAPNHDGGRIAFGPDQLLYITTGDAGQEKLAQDTTSLAGKILRLADDGSIPSDNPFGNAVYSYGHRNAQGLAWDEQGQLWATEHGPSGVSSGFDELNRIEKGANYGWPVIQGGQQRLNMKSPIIQSGADDTWAPAGTTIVGEVLLFTGLRGQALYSTSLSGGTAGELTTHFRQEYGRLRVVTLGPDNWLYLATSNTDGRGQPEANDDKIIKISPELLGIKP